MVGCFLKRVVHVRTFFNVKVSVVESFPNDVAISENCLVDSFYNKVEGEGGGLRL